MSYLSLIVVVPSDVHMPPRHIVPCWEMFDLVFEDRNHLIRWDGFDLSGGMVVGWFECLCCHCAIM